MKVLAFIFWSRAKMYRGLRAAALQGENGVRLGRQQEAEKA